MRPRSPQGQNGKWKLTSPPPKMKLHLGACGRVKLCHGKIISQPCKFENKDSLAKLTALGTPVMLNTATLDG